MIEKRKSISCSYICFSVCIFILDFIVSCVRYPLQGIVGTLQIAFPYFMIILAFPLVAYMVETQGIDRLFFIMNCIAFIWYVVIIVQSISYSKTGIVFLNGYYSSAIPHTRNGKIRIGLFEYGNIAIIYNFYKFYISENIKKKIKYLVLCTIGVFCLISIEQTRMYTISIICSLFSILVLYNKKTRNYSINKLLILIIASYFVIEIVDSNLSNIIMSGQNALSSANRLYAIKYYWNVFLHKPFLGLGYANSSFYPRIVMGESLLAATSDTGIIGQLSRMGIFVIPVYIGMLFYFYMVAKKTKNQSDNKDYVFLLAIITFLILTSGSLIIFDAERYLLYPVLFAVYYYYDIRSSVCDDSISDYYSVI